MASPSTTLAAPLPTVRSPSPRVSHPSLEQIQGSTVLFWAKFSPLTLKALAIGPKIASVVFAALDGITVVQAIGMMLNWVGVATAWTQAFPFMFSFLGLSVTLLALKSLRLLFRGLDQGIIEPWIKKCAADGAPDSVTQGVPTPTGHTPLAGCVMIGAAYKILTVVAPNLDAYASSPDKKKEALRDHLGKLKEAFKVVFEDERSHSLGGTIEFICSHLFGIQSERDSINSSDFSTRVKKVTAEIEGDTALVPMIIYPPDLERLNNYRDQVVQVARSYFLDAPKDMATGTWVEFANSKCTGTRSASDSEDLAVEKSDEDFKLDLLKATSDFLTALQSIEDSDAQEIGWVEIQLKGPEYYPLYKARQKIETALMGLRKLPGIRQEQLPLPLTFIEAITFIEAQERDQ